MNTTTNLDIFGGALEFVDALGEHVEPVSASLAELSHPLRTYILGRHG